MTFFLLQRMQRISSITKLNISKTGELLGNHGLGLSLNQIRVASLLSKTSDGIFRIKRSLAPAVAACSGIGVALTGTEFARSLTIKAMSVEKQENREDDLGKPNEYWTSESCKLFDKLSKDLENDNNEWEKLKSKRPSGDHQIFTRAFNENGKCFEYAFFFCKSKQQLKGVIQFGPYTQGPPGCVHGGATATMMDAALGVCAHRSGYRCVTANLSTNYKKFLPLGTTVFVESQVDRVEERKIFLSASMKSSDERTLYATATALFIKV